MSGGGARAATIPRFERAIRCLLAIQRGEAVGAVWMMEKLHISLAQAKRDMEELERVLPVTRHKVVKNGRSFLMLGLDPKKGLHLRHGNAHSAPSQGARLLARPGS